MIKTLLMMGISLLAATGMDATESGLTLPPLHISDTKGVTAVVDFASARFTVLIVLNGSTCAGFLEERSDWDKIAKESDPKEVKVLGILVDDSDPKALMDRYGFGFPVYKDTKGEVQRALDYGQYPMKFIVDSRGRVLNIGWPSQFKERRNVLSKELEYLMYLLSDSSAQPQSTKIQ